MKCPECDRDKIPGTIEIGSILRLPNDKNCVRCGTKLIDETGDICPSCNYPKREHTLKTSNSNPFEPFCGKCGMRVG